MIQYLVQYIKKCVQSLCKIKDMAKVKFFFISLDTGNTTATSLQRDKNTKIDPKDTVRTSSFMDKPAKLLSDMRTSE